MITLVDTLRSAPVQSIGTTELVGIVLAIAGFGLTAIVALLRVGVVIGRHEEFKESVNREIKELKQSDNHSITREEMDARFGEMRSEIGGVRARMDDIIELVREAMRSFAARNGS